MAVTIGPGWTIGAGWTLGGPPVPTLVLSLDAGNPSSYPGSGSTWTDTVGGKTFTLNGGPTYNSGNGGYLSFVPASSQWANSSTSLSSLSTWTVEAWHYYTGTNTGVAPCIVTELFPSATNNINYTLGSTISGSTNLQAGFFNGSWQTTPTGYSLTADAWYQVVGTYDGATIKLYVNNSVVQTASYAGTPISGGSGIRLMRRWDDTDYWGGRLSIVKIWDGDIGASAVTSSWNANKSRFGL